MTNQEICYKRIDYPGAPNGGQKYDETCQLPVWHTCDCDSNGEQCNVLCWRCEQDFEVAAAHLIEDLK